MGSVNNVASPRNDAHQDAFRMVADVEENPNPTDSQAIDAGLTSSTGQEFSPSRAELPRCDAHWPEALG